MTTAAPRDESTLLSEARAGSNAAFTALIGSKRATLYRHSYRMLGSGSEADDAVQDTLLRAWQRLDTFDGRGSFDAWLYRIATNVCLDRLRGRRAKSHPVHLAPASALGVSMETGAADVEWVLPLGASAMASSPEETAIEAEHISFAFVVALQRLPARQRAALLLHDVLGFAPEEVATVLEASPSAVNSLLHRARQTMNESPRVAPADPDSPDVKALLDRYIRAWRLADISRFLETVSDDVRMSMPPLRTWFLGSTDVGGFVAAAIFGPAAGVGVPMVPGQVNGQSAVATYRPSPDGGWAASGLQVLDVDEHDMLITSITSFLDPQIAISCGFPAELPAA